MFSGQVWFMVGNVLREWCGQLHLDMCKGHQVGVPTGPPDWLFSVLNNPVCHFVILRRFFGLFSMFDI
jgi:hypothetical protein